MKDRETEESEELICDELMKLDPWADNTPDIFSERENTVHTTIETFRKYICLVQKLPPLQIETPKHETFLTAAYLRLSVASALNVCPQADTPLRYWWILLDAQRDAFEYTSTANPTVEELAEIIRKTTRSTNDCFECRRGKLPPGWSDILRARGENRDFYELAKDVGFDAVSQTYSGLGWDVDELFQQIPEEDGKCLFDVLIEHDIDESVLRRFVFQFCWKRERERLIAEFLGQLSDYEKRLLQI